MSRDAEIVAYLLGELPPGEHAALEGRMLHDPALRGDVDRMRRVVAGLGSMPAAGWGVAEPPPLPDLPPLGGLTPARRWSPSRLRPLAAVAAAVVVLAAGIGIGAWLAGGGADPDGPALTLEALRPDGTAAGVARPAGGDGDDLRLRVSGLSPSAQGEFYELWLLDGPERIVSLGSFRVPASGSAEVEVPLPVPLGDFAFIDVSVERDDGDPGHSGDSVLRGPTTET